MQGDGGGDEGRGMVSVWRGENCVWGEGWENGWRGVACV